MAFLGYTSEESKVRREADLKRMRERGSQKGTTKRIGTETKKARSNEARLSRTAIGRINSLNASGPRQRARSSLTVAIESLSAGETVWLECDSGSVHGAARTANRKVITRTAFKNGVKGVRVTAA